MIIRLFVFLLAKMAVFSHARASQAGPIKSGVSRGKLQIGGEQISFTAVSREGKVAYRGGMVGDRLRLRSHSFINGNEDVEVYSFVRW